MAKKAAVKKRTAISSEKIDEEKKTIVITADDAAITPAEAGSKTVTSTRSDMIDGEFRGDFTRDTFDPLKHFTRVLMQQGRVQLDADWNEQSSILLHYLQALAADLIGPFGGPYAYSGFLIMPKENLTDDFYIGKGRYYVNGVLCENEERIRYTKQLSASAANPITLPGDNRYFVYLDAWERALSHIEDADIREVALNGPDTAARAKTEWMVRISDTLPAGAVGTDSGEGGMTCDQIRKQFIDMLPKIPSFFGRMRPDMNSDVRSDDICIINPDTKYRGVENQLYRVEIHTGGAAGKDGATFKWSRENGSVQFPILSLNKKELSLGHLGKDESLSLKPGNFIEIVDDDSVKQGYDLDDLMKAFEDTSYRIENERKLFEVEHVDHARLTVTLVDSPGLSYGKTSVNHPVLRRWDQTKPDADDNCTAIVESSGSKENYFDLEDGIRIQFSVLPKQKRSIYLPGNYWLLPARVITGAIDWPVSGGEYVALPPHGVIHGYAPLGIITVEGRSVSLQQDCRCRFHSHCEPPD